MVHLREVQRGREKGARQCPFSKKDFGLRAPEDALSASALPTGHMLQSILPEGCLRKHFEIAAVPSGRLLELRQELGLNAFILTEII